MIVSYVLGYFNRNKQNSYAALETIGNLVENCLRNQQKSFNMVNVNPTIVDDNLPSLNLFGNIKKTGYI